MKCPTCRTEGTFLSVDMDFFDYREPRLTTEFLESLLSLKVPVTAVMNHQQMLRIVNDSPSRYLLNMDLHSDLQANWLATSLHCGSWVSYVKWAPSGTYHWWDCSETHGDCSVEDYIFYKGKSFVTKTSSTRWKDIRYTYSLKNPNLSNINIIEVAVCMSPSYSHPAVIPIFRQWVVSNGIRYIKGRKKENHARNVSLPVAS
jgi:hypothetical protein